MIESFYQIDYIGIMGNSKFNSYGETNGMINFEQFRGLYTYYSGSFIQTNNILTYYSQVYYLL